jgi:hypothetical protein
MSLTSVSTDVVSFGGVVEEFRSDPALGSVCVWRRRRLADTCGFEDISASSGQAALEFADVHVLFCGANTPSKLGA